MKYLIGIVFLFHSAMVVGQKYYTLNNAPASVKANYEKAVQQLTSDEQDKGLTLLKSLANNNPALLDALNFLGQHYSNRDAWVSMSYYQKSASLYPCFSPENLLLLVELENDHGVLENALVHVNQYLQCEKVYDRTRAVRLKKELEFKQYLMGHPVSYNPVNLGGKVNTHNHEYHPYIRGFDAELIVTSDTFLPRDTAHFNRFGSVNEDIKSFKKSGKEWAKQSVWGNFNTRNNEGAVTISGDGKWLTFTQCNKKEDKGDCDLVYGKRDVNEWGTLHSFGDLINTDEWESQPCFSYDGNTLVFVRDHMSQTDILMSKKLADGTWTEPVYLPFNTGGNEHSPFLHPDGNTLYFISDSYLGMGGDDIFVTHLHANGSWTTPENLGYPINTINDELAISVSMDGKTAYFASDRKGGLGGMDIYSFELPENVRPMLIHLSGSITSFNGDTLGNSELQIKNLSNQTLTTIPVNGKQFDVTLSPGSAYQLRVQVPGYFAPESVWVPLDSNHYQSLRADFVVHDLNPRNAIVLKNVRFVQSKDELLPDSFSELEALLQWLRTSEMIKIRISGHTDNVGDPKDNLELSEKRALKVKNWLIENGISQNRLKSIGYGSVRPLVPNDCEDNKRLNRRVEFEVIQ